MQCDIKQTKMICFIYSECNYVASCVCHFAVSFVGPLMFHLRGMGPRGMRPGMRPPFAPRGPPFDPRESDSFFRPPFDEMRGRPGPHIRPPFGPMGPPAMHGPDGPWRNQEGGGPASWSGQEPDGHGQRENHLPREKQKLTKHQDYKNMSERENRNRNRKSRWGNISPQMTDDVDEMPSEEAENKIGISDDSKLEAKDSFDASASAIDQQNLLMQKNQDESVIHEQNMMHSDRENEFASISNDNNVDEMSYKNDEANAFEIGVDHFSSNDLALTQQGEEEQCEYEAPIPAEESAQQNVVQSIEQIGHVSENYSEQSVEQQADLL